MEGTTEQGRGQVAVFSETCMATDLQWTCVDSVNFPHSTAGAWDEIRATSPDPPHPLTVSNRARPQKCEGHWFEWHQLMCAALLCCSSFWSQVLGEAELSLRAPFAWLWRAVPNNHHSFPSCMWRLAYSAPDGVGRFFFLKPQQIWSLAAVCIHLGVCKGECKACAVVRDPQVLQMCHIWQSGWTMGCSHSCAWLCFLAHIFLNAAGQLWPGLRSFLPQWGKVNPACCFCNNVKETFLSALGSSVGLVWTHPPSEIVLFVQFWKHHFCWAWSPDSKEDKQ